MVADLETRGSVASLFSRRQIPWHALGKIIQDDITSKEDVLALAKLDNWNTRLEHRKPAPGYSTHLEAYDVVRDNPWYEPGNDTGEEPYNILGSVGPRYEVLQNEELADFAELLLPAGRWETAGSLKHGTTVFMSMALDSKLTIDDGGINEVIECYLVVFNSHDGSSRLTAMVTNVRPVCSNTLDHGLKNASRKISFRHTKSMEEKMKAAQKTLNLATNYNEEFLVNAETLLAAPVSNNEYSEIIMEIYPEPTNGKKVSLTRWNNQIDDLEAIWRSDTIEPIRNTGWGVYNAIEEEFQWNRRIYKDNTENFWAAGAGFDDEESKLKTKLFQQVNELVFN